MTDRYEWLPFGESDARRHDARALEHERLGHPPQYAAKSREKAAKWRRRALITQSATLVEGMSNTLMENFRVTERMILSQVEELIIRGNS